MPLEGHAHVECILSRGLPQGGEGEAPAGMWTPNMGLAYTKSVLLAVRRAPAGTWTPDTGPVSTKTT